MGSTVRDGARPSGNQRKQHFGRADLSQRIEIEDDPSYTVEMNVGRVETAWPEVPNTDLWFTVGASVNKAVGLTGAPTSGRVAGRCAR
jgi:hypothetical protein